MTDRTLQQYGPWPSDLEALVAMARYRDGWKFWLQDEERLDAWLAVKGESDE
jgi:hypothetical protein